MMLKEKLHNTKMSKDESVTSYWSKKTQVRDMLCVFREIIVEDE